MNVEQRSKYRSDPQLLVGRKAGEHIIIAVKGQKVTLSNGATMSLGRLLSGGYLREE